jgi:hypothetical protein
MGLELCGEFTESSFDVFDLSFSATKDCMKNDFFQNMVINLVDFRATFFSLEGNRFSNDQSENNRVLLFYNDCICHKFRFREYF